jgi:hypothetical protein
MEFWLFLLAIVGAIVALAIRSRIAKLENRVTELGRMNDRHAAAGTVLHERIEALRQRVDADELRIAELLRRPTALPPTPAPAASPAPEAGPLVAAAAPSVEAPDALAPVAETAGPSGAQPGAIVATVSLEPEPAQPAAEADAPAPAIRDEVPSVAARLDEAPAVPPAAPTESPGVAPAAVATESAPPASAAAEQAAEAAPSPPAAAPPAPPAEPAAPPARAFDWESLVGVRLFSWVAGVAFVLAAIFFLRYSIDQGLLGPPIRMAIGIVVGAGLLVVSETRNRARWSVTANALGAAGIAILFATFFAADALWHLLPQPATFGLMVLVTTVAVLLAIRHDSVFIALLGLVGGFSTPILLSTGEDRPIGLFAYLLILNAGLAWVGRRRGWTVLIALSVAFTAVYQWGWVMKFLLDKPEELPIAVAAFIVFPVLIAVSRLVPARGDVAGSEDHRAAFERTAVVSAGLPLLFALCFAWVPALGDHYVLLFAYLFLLDLGLAVLAAATRNLALHGASALATALVFAGWLPTAYGAYAWPAVLAFVSLFVVFFLVAPFGGRWLQRKITSDPRPPVELAPVRVVAPLLLFPIPVLVYMEPAAASPLLPFGVMFGLLVAVAAVALVEAAGALHFLAAFFAVVAEGVWSAKHLSPPRLHEALLLYGAFGVFHLSVPLVARRLGKRMDPEWSAPALLVASLALLLFLAAGPVAHLALWGMAILLAILNLGLFFDPRPGRVSWLAGLGMMLSWLVIAVWWATAMVTALLLPALAIVGGFAVLLMAGNLWAERQLGGEKSANRSATYLGLVGHLFLLFVASQPALAAPPWPLFGVLFVLDLAILVAALFSRRGELHLATVAASHLVLATWVLTTHDRPSVTLPWPDVGLLAALGVAALGMVSIPLARRRAAPGGLFNASGAVGLLGLMVVVALAEGSPFAPAFGWLVAVPSIALVALAWLGAETELQWLMLLALVPYAAGTYAWTATGGTVRTEHFREIVVVAGAPYAIWLAYPAWLGGRALASRHAHVAAVLASFVFFGFGHHAISIAGFTPYIGALPVAQALLLLAILYRLLTVEPLESRDTGRLALVAGAALAFITAAIPLQLDKQWITIGWGLEAAALAWLYRRIVHKGLLAAAGGLAIAVVLRLSLNPAVLSYHPRGAVPILNWYLYAYLVSAIALLVGGLLLVDQDDGFAELPKVPRVSSIMRAGATLLLFLLVNIEIADYWSTGSEITFNFSSGIAQDLTYTLGWAIFAIALLTVGIVRQMRNARLTALLLLVVTVAKAFLHDLWRLGGLYRVGSFVGLAVSLALVAVVLQRFVLPQAPEKKAP